VGSRRTLGGKGLFEHIRDPKKKAVRSEMLNRRQKTGRGASKVSIKRQEMFEKKIGVETGTAKVQRHRKKNFRIPPRHPIRRFEAGGDVGTKGWGGG